MKLLSMSRGKGLLTLTVLLPILLAGSAEAQQRRVFVTSTTSGPDLGGLAGADTVCNTLAADAGLGGAWVAWLSTQSVNAEDRLTPGSGPFVRAAGAPGTIALRRDPYQLRYRRTDSQ